MSLLLYPRNSCNQEPFIDHMQNGTVELGELGVHWSGMGGMGLETPDTAVQSCALSTDASGMLRSSSGLQPGAVLCPGKLLDFRDKVLCSQRTQLSALERWDRNTVSVKQPFDHWKATTNMLKASSSFWILPSRQHRLDSQTCWAPAGQSQT